MLKFDNKKFFITYPRSDFVLESLLNHLKKGFLEHTGQNVTKYIVCKEAHEDGEPHHHAFIELARPFRGKVPASFLDYQERHPSIETVTNYQGAIKYLKKEGNFITNMDFEKKVTKDDIAKMVLTGIALTEVVEKYPKYLFGYSRLKVDLAMYRLDLKKLDPLDRPCGIWIGGPSGSGKSTIATTKFGPYYFKGPNKWWDGYNGEETVVCEDVDISWKDCIPYLKIWADKYEFLGECKGGTIRLRPKRVVITSNRTLEELLELLGWPKDDYTPYTRRFRQYWITSFSDWEEQL